MQQSDTVKTASNKRTLIFVMAVFALPVVASMMLYLTGWKPSNTVNYGELIQPARQIGDTTLQTLDGKPVQLKVLQGKWTMVYFGSSSCTEACMKNLYYMRQVHAAQGKEVDRLQRVFIVTDATAATTLKTRLTAYPDMHIWKAENTAMADLAKSFGINSAQLAENQDIYIVDPKGNLMMRYAPGADPAGMRKDIERLLKYS